MHALHQVLLEAADRRFPPVDGQVSVLPALLGGRQAVVAFTGHSIVATDRSSAEVAEQGADGFGGALAPEFLLWLARGAAIGTNDVTLVARGLKGKALAGTEPEDPAHLPARPERRGLRPRRDLHDHPRVRHALALRTSVEVFADDRGLVTLADGLGGRREMSVQLFDGTAGGAGRALIGQARRLVAPDEWLFAAVSPGNARSLRAFLAAGFEPIGSEVIIGPGA